MNPHKQQKNIDWYEKVLANNPCVLAPMEAVNDVAFLELCAQHKFGMVFTAAIDSLDKKIYDKKLLKEISCPVILQIRVNTKEDAQEIITYFDDVVDGFDLNCGCPEGDILGAKKGGYLLTQPQKIKELVSYMCECTTKPVSVKIRRGFDEKRENFIDVAKAAQEGGASAIYFHSRFVKQGYRGKANWSCFEKLKKEISIPVIANGDIIKAGHAKALLETKQCDGIMLGRGAQKNPLLATEILNTIQQEKISEQNLKNICLEYIALAQKYSTPFSMCQDHIAWFVSGQKNASELKKTIRQTTSFEDLELFCEEQII